jgi:predicted RNA-binding protein associated with RNAse of E/G family
MVRVHPVGRPYAVLRAWLGDEAAFSGWYVNLEQPWRRTPIGFDTRDHLLDVVVDDDLDGWRFKDDDELAWATEVGIYDAGQAASIRDAGRRAIEDVEVRRWPFDEAAWESLVPDPTWPVPELPPAWNRP